MSTASTVQGAARGAAWNIGTSVLSRALGMVGTLLLIRHVTPADYGDASAATVVASTFMQFSTLGVGIYAITRREATEDELFHATFIHLALGVLPLLTLFFLGRPLSGFFEAPLLYRYLPPMALAMAADRIGFMPERILIRQLRFRRLGGIRSLGELSYTGVSLGLAIAGWGGMSIIIGNIARSGLKAILTIASVERRSWLHVVKLRLAVLRRIGAYGLEVAIQSVAGFGARRWDHVLVSRMFGSGVMGAYNLAYNLADVPAVHIGEQITDVLQASFAHLPDDERRRVFDKSLGLIALCTFPVAIGMGAVAPTLAAIFLDRRWAGTGVLLMILSAMSLARPVYGAVASVIMVARGPRITMILEWLTLAVLLGLIATLGRLGPAWACVAVGIAFGARTIAGVIIAARILALPLARLFLAMLGPLLACVPLVGAVVLVKHEFDRWAVTSDLALLATQIVVGGVAFVAAALVLAPQASQRVIGLARRRGRAS